MNLPSTGTPKVVLPNTYYYFQSDYFPTVTFTAILQKRTVTVWSYLTGQSVGHYDITDDDGLWSCVQTIAQDWEDLIAEETQEIAQEIWDLVDFDLLERTLGYGKD